MQSGIIKNISALQVVFLEAELPSKKKTHAVNRLRTGQLGQKQWLLWVALLQRHRDPESGVQLQGAVRDARTDIQINNDAVLLGRVKQYVRPTLQ